MTEATTIDRKTFFRLVRESVFRGKIKQSAVDAINAILDECARRKLTDTRMVGYVLGTVRGECGPDMKAKREYGKGRGKSYGRPHAKTGQTYYGRGYVQLTWYTNYLRQERKLKLPLTTEPDLALRPDVAAKILVGGMIAGDFTKTKLSTYFTRTKTDWLNARRIINGTDKAAKYAAWARAFHYALERATVPLKAPEDLTESRTMGGAGTAAIGGAVVTGTQITEAIETAKEAHSYLGWHMLGVVIGVLIVLGAAAALYARWDDAGRPGWRKILGGRSIGEILTETIRAWFGRKIREAG